MQCFRQVGGQPERLHWAQSAWLQTTAMTDFSVISLFVATIHVCLTGNLERIKLRLFCENMESLMFYGTKQQLASCSFWSPSTLRPACLHVLWSRMDYFHPDKMGKDFEEVSISTSKCHSISQLFHLLVVLQHFEVTNFCARILVLFR